MSKIEDKALEKYPYKEGYDVELPYPSTYDENKDQREAFIEGYHQAEKDLALTWEDIEQICDIAFEEACRLQRNMKASLIYKEQHYQEVLKRFKNLKK